MNDIRRLQHAIIEEFPDAGVVLAFPQFDGDAWLLRVCRGDHALAVDWLESCEFRVAAFGIDDPDDKRPVFGPPRDEQYDSFEGVLARATQILDKKLSTASQDPKPTGHKRADGGSLKGAPR